MISILDRQNAVTLIDAARGEGARLAPACQTLGLTRRTYHRWRRADGGVSRDQRPRAERPTPANKLSAAECQAVLDTAHRPEFASAPPGQIVPALADDEGRYLASESTVYRVLRDADEQHPRGRARAAGASSPADHVYRHRPQSGLGLGYLCAMTARRLR